MRRRSSACRKPLPRKGRDRSTRRCPNRRRASPRNGSQNRQFHLILDATHGSMNFPRSQTQGHLSSCEVIKKPLGGGKRPHSRLIDILHCLSDHPIEIVHMVIDQFFSLREINKQENRRTRRNWKDLLWSNKIIKAKGFKYTIGNNPQKLSRHANSALPSSNREDQLTEATLESPVEII